MAAICPDDIDPATWAFLPIEIQRELSGLQNAGVVQTPSSCFADRPNIKRKASDYAASQSIITNWASVSNRPLLTSAESIDLTSAHSNEEIAPSVYPVECTTVKERAKFVHQQQSLFSFGNDRLLEADLFSDVGFPPTAESIDGRRDTGKQDMHKNGVPNKELLCNCQAAVKLRQVSKDGPNQGRYFASCLLRACNFFSWADNVPHAEGVSKLTWKRFQKSEGWTLFGNKGILRMSPNDVFQGGVGDCWFLSAVAVLAERTDLIQKIVKNSELTDDQGITFALFIDGLWRNITVDNYLPCLQGGHVKKRNKNSRDKINDTLIIDADGSKLAYSKANNKRLWVPLLEKAYAKAHGSYHAISGGHIHEALLDLTGAPGQVIDFSDADFNSEETWILLVSYNESHFPMGCATSSSGEGIVGCHAYSILDVKEISDAVIGQQQNLESYFEVTKQENVSSHSVNTKKTKKNTDHSEIITQEGNIRVLRIRNPWGKKEWNGDFGEKSDVWTCKLRKLLDKGNKNDGTFWITYHDFLRRFCSVDICKAHTGSGWGGVSCQTETLGRHSRHIVDDDVSHFYYDSPIGDRNDCQFERDVAKNNGLLASVRNDNDNDNLRTNQKNQWNDNIKYEFSPCRNKNLESMMNDDVKSSKRSDQKNNINNDIHHIGNDSNKCHNIVINKVNNHTNNENGECNIKIKLQGDETINEKKHILGKKHIPYSSNIRDNYAVKQKLPNYPMMYTNSVFDISTKNFFIFTVSKPTWMYLSLIQKTKRGKARTDEDRKYWYSSLALVITEINQDIKIEYNGNSSNMSSRMNSKSTENQGKDPTSTSTSTCDNVVQSHHLGNLVAYGFDGAVRDSTPIELQLPPGRYVAIPLDFSSGVHVSQRADRGKERGRAGERDVNSEKFMLRMYSSCTVGIERVDCLHSMHSQDKHRSDIPASASSSSFPSSLFSSTHSSYSSFSSSSSSHSSVPTSTSTSFTQASKLTQNSPSQPNKSAPLLALPNIFSIALLKCLQPLLGENSSGSKIHSKGLKKKKLILYDVNKKAFTLDGSSQIVIFNGNQINPKIIEVEVEVEAEAQWNNNIIDLSEDIPEKNLPTKIRNNSKNNDIDVQYFPTCNSSNSSSYLVRQYLEVSKIQESENILFLVGINRTSKYFKFSMSVQTCNYNMTCPFAFKKARSISKLNPSDNMPQLSKEEYEKEKKKCDFYTINSYLPPKSYRLLGIFVSSPLGQNMNTPNVPIFGPQREIQNNSSSIRVSSFGLDCIDHEAYNSKSIYKNGNNGGCYPERYSSTNLDKPFSHTIYECNRTHNFQCSHNSNHVTRTDDKNKETCNNTGHFIGSHGHEIGEIIKYENSLEIPYHLRIFV